MVHAEYAANDNVVILPTSSNFAINRHQWCIERYGHVVTIHIANSITLPDDFQQQLNFWFQMYINDDFTYQSDMDENNVLHLHFYFKNPKEAMHFKLKWGGR